MAMAMEQEKDREKERSKFKNFDKYADFKIQQHEERRNSIADDLDDEDVYTILSKEDLYDIARKRKLEANLHMSHDELVQLLKNTGNIK